MHRFARAFELTVSYFAIAVLLLLIVATNTVPTSYAATASATAASSSCVAPTFYSMTVTPAYINTPWSLPLLSTIDGSYTAKVTATGLPVGIVLDDQQTTLTAGGTVLHNWVLDGTPTQLGTYSITITAQNSCGGASTIVTLPINAAAQAQAAVSFDPASLTATTPNPIITGTSNTQNINLSVQNSSGLTIFSSPAVAVSSGRWSVQLSNLLSGIYRLALSSNGTLLVPATLNVTLTSTVVPAPTQVTTVVPTQAVTTTTINAGTTSSSICPNISVTMQMGGTGTAVVALQNFLISKGLLAQGNASGYFGALTRAAVQKFQIQQGIVSSGTESSTGFGSVGVRTRAAMQVGCQSGVSTVPSTPTQTIQCPQISVPSCQGGTLVSRGVDQNHCALGYQCQLPTAPIPTQVSCPAVSYPSCGTGYLATPLGTDTNGCSMGYTCQAVNSCQTYFTPTCAAGQTLVTGTASNGCAAQPYCAGTATPTASLTASPSSGSAPLSVIFSTAGLSAGFNYYIDYGDGNTSSTIPGPCVGTCDARIMSIALAPQHTYSIQGSHDATLRVQTGTPSVAAGSIVANATVNVIGNGIGPVILIDCPAGYVPAQGATIGAQPTCVPMSAFSVSTTQISFPSAVTFSGNAGVGCNGGNFTLSYGDGQSDSVSIPADSCYGGFTQSHTYQGTGTYTATLTSNTGKVIGSITVTDGFFNNSF